VPTTVYVVVLAGETVTVVPLRLPGFHTYVDAPFAVSVVEDPVQIDDVPAVAVTVGVPTTVTVTVLVLVQPFDAVPTTVYVVVLVGETVTVVPVRLPGFHTYVAPPLPVSVVLLPVQMVPLAADDVMVGVVFTVMVRVDVFVQPFAFVPVTVYVVVVAGETVTVVPLRLPGFHTYVTPPVAVIEVLDPEQMVAFVVVVLIVGRLLTVTVTVCVFEQPPGAVPTTV
jgi:uncharacterized protein with GYD domain